MKRNRRRHATVLHRLAPLFKVVLACSFLGAASIGYVWQKEQIHQLTQIQKQKEEDLEGILQENQQLREQYYYMVSPGQLEERVRRMNLNLVQQKNHQIYTIQVPVLAGQSKESPPFRTYASRFIRPAEWRGAD